MVEIENQSAVQARSREMDFLSVDEAAKILGLSVASLRKMRSLNTGPVSYKYNGKIGYHLQDLEEWRTEQLESGRRGGNK